MVASDVSPDPSDDTAWFLMRAVLSGAFAGTIASVVTVAVERMGGLMGGVLGTTPTTIISAAIGIYLGARDNLPEFEAAMWSVPGGAILDILFLYCWKVLPKLISQQSTPSRNMRLGIIVTVSLTLWLTSALLLVNLVQRMEESNVSLFWFGIICWLGMFALGVAAVTIHHQPAPKGARRISRVVFVCRGLCAGVAIMCGVLIARTSSVAGGVVSVFPAIFLTTMVSLWVQAGSGEEVATGAAGPMMLGMTSVAGFALMSTAVFPAVGPYWGSFVCWVISCVFITTPIVLFLRFLDRRRSPNQDVDKADIASGTELGNEEPSSPSSSSKRSSVEGRDTELEVAALVPQSEPCSSSKMFLSDRTV